MAQNIQPPKHTRIEKVWEMWSCEGGGMSFECRVHVVTRQLDNGGGASHLGESTHAIVEENEKNSKWNHIWIYLAT